MLNRFWIFSLATIALLLSVGAGPESATVTMKNLQFLPAVVQIKAGETVTWTNADDRDHTVAGAGIKSGNIKPGRTFSHTFAKAGNYPYGCTYHPRMRGTVQVSD